MKDLKLIIYPSCPLEGIKRVDLEFRTESKTAKKYFQVGNIDIDQIKVETLSSLPSFNLFVSETPLKAIYRGWMLSVDRYNVLYDYLKEKYNIILINNPKQYSNCHYFPNAYDSISAYTPKAIYRPVNEIEDLIKLSAITFNDKSIFLKDYVKSESAYLEATFVENGANTADLKKAIDKLIELRGKELNIGIVIKEQIDISRINNEDLEWRVFVFEGHILGVFKRFDSDINLDHEQQAKLYQLISDVSVNLQKVSNFFTIDIVLQTDEQFVLMEVGDGQVSGIPYDNDIAIFYKNLSEI